MNIKSIRVRFLITMFANVLRVVFSFGTGLIIARYLGPTEYGNFSFLLGSFLSIATMVNMASSGAFFTFISRKQRGKMFFVYYSLWILIQFLLLLLLVLFLPAALRQKIWLGQPNEIVLVALFANFSMNQIWQYFGQLGESIRDTIGVQVRNIALAITYFVCVLLIARFHLMSVKNLLILNSIIYLLFVWLYGLRLYRAKVFSHENSETLLDIVGEFKTYCLPLVIFSLVCFVYQFLDYWLLQRFGGAIQQGYYAVGLRFATLSLIATTSILQVFWKEIAEAHASGNENRVRDLYTIILRGLYFLGAVISCLLIPFSREILVLLLGVDYQKAWLPLSLMFLYPVHQSMGQVTGALLLATGRTKTKACIGLFFMCISVPITYYVLAPKNQFIAGLNLGAVGLSLKMVIIQLLQVNVTAFFIARYLKLTFSCWHQINVLLLLIPLGFLCKFCSQWSLSQITSYPHSLLTMAISGIYYIGAVLTLVYFLPSLAGMNKSQINKGFRLIQEKIKFV